MSVGIDLVPPRKTIPKRKLISRLLSLAEKPSLQHVLRSGLLVVLLANYGPFTNPDVRFCAVIRSICAYAM